MSLGKSLWQRTVEWFRHSARPILKAVESQSIVDEFDKLAHQIEEQEKKKDILFPICLLGQAGVGKSTLLNTLIAETGIVVPSGGGTGPLTANALRVIHGAAPAFEVRYHTKEPINQTRFILELALARRLSSTAAAEIESSLPPDAPEDAAELHLDPEEQSSTRTTDAISRASLLVGGAQTAQRDLPYLVDALRWVLGQELKHQTEFRGEDLVRLREVQEALNKAAQNVKSRFDSRMDHQFGFRLRNHACGFLAPLIREMTIHWPSPLLQDSLELVDLPGIGILNDSYASVTTEYLRSKSKAVMLVADSRGIRREDAELLRNSGFLNRLLHASADLTADPVALIVVVVKIDDVAVENWRNDKQLHGKAMKSKAEHFDEQVQSCRKEIAKKIDTFVREIWGDETPGKQEVISSLVANLQVFPVSAPEYRLHCSDDEDDARPFLPDIESTNIPSLREAISEIARRCLAEQERRSVEVIQRFLGQLRARLEVLHAQRSEEKQADEELRRFKANLDEFMAPLQREFDTRRGGFRNFLRKTVPAQVESKVKTAGAKAQKKINGYLDQLSDAHWKTLQAAVRKEGAFYGKRHINLPYDFALRFEEPVAEVWSRELLVEVRKETKEFAEYQTSAVSQILDWAKKQGLRRSNRLLEALDETVKQHVRQVNAVGKEAVDELRDQVRNELIRKIEEPIRRKCKRFVNDEKHVGTGAKARILELFVQLAEDVVEAASAPTVQLLVTKFKEVDQEILTAFSTQDDPLKSAADALIQRRATNQMPKDEDAAQLIESIEKAISVAPFSEVQEQGIGK